MTTSISALLALAFIAGGFYWMHQKNQPRVFELPAAPGGPTANRSASRSPQPGREAAPESAADTAADPSAVTDPRKKPAPDSGMNLVAGEILEFTANVSNLSKVANLRLQVLEKRAFDGKSAWHLQATAHTENPLRMVFALDDQFDSYSDSASLTSLQYEMHLNERGQKVDSVQRMLPNSRDAAPNEVTAARVLPGTRDPLGMMQFLRHVDWSKSQEVQSPVYDGRKMYEVHARLVNSNESVTVTAGTYVASKIVLQVLDNGAEAKDTHFTLFLANNPARTPVLLEAVLPFATARVELASAR